MTEICKNLKDRTEEDLVLVCMYSHKYYILVLMFNFYYAQINHCLLLL